MNTKISLTYNDVPYTLEYDRMAIKAMEASGFSVEEFIKKPLSNIELAFAGAFIKNHRKTKENVIASWNKNKAPYTRSHDNSYCYYSEF